MTKEQITAKSRASILGQAMHQIKVQLDHNDFDLVDYSNDNCLLNHVIRFRVECYFIESELTR